MFSSLDLKIWTTIAYSDQFYYPLTKNEIYQRLASSEESIQTTDNKLVSLNDIKIRLDSYVVKNWIYQHNNHYGLKAGYLDTDAFVDAVDDRKRKKETSVKIRRESQALLGICLKIPWILAIGISGAVAVDNACVNDDLDFLMVVQKNRLWLTRSILLIFSLIKGKKLPFWNHNLLQKDRWCFNLWMEEDKLGINNTRHNLFTAYEIMQIDWLFDRTDIEQRFVFENKWVAKFLFNYPVGDCCKTTIKKSTDGNLALLAVNKIIYNLEKSHLSKKNLIPQENLALSQAWMHDNTSYIKYLDGFESLLNETISAFSKH